MALKEHSWVVLACVMDVLDENPYLMQSQERMIGGGAGEWKLMESGFSVGNPVLEMAGCLGLGDECRN